MNNSDGFMFVGMYRFMYKRKIYIVRDRLVSLFICKLLCFKYRDFIIEENLKYYYEVCLFF